MIDIIIQFTVYLHTNIKEILAFRIDIIKEFFKKRCKDKV